jgi:hypothetical protein
MNAGDVIAEGRIKASQAPAPAKAKMQDADKKGASKDGENIKDNAPENREIGCTANGELAKAMEVADGPEQGMQSLKWIIHEMEHHEELHCCLERVFAEVCGLLHFA